MSDEQLAQVLRGCADTMNGWLDELSAIPGPRAEGWSRAFAGSRFHLIAGANDLAPQKRAAGRTVKTRIGRLRSASGMTRKRLAERLGLDAKTIGRWERETEEVPVQHVATMAELFGVSRAHVLGLDD